MNYKKYKRGYFMPPKSSGKWMEKEYIEKAPAWCSVDLRDGNQALVIPMSLEEKLDYFKILTKVGFKEIEVGFPAASDTEFEFIRVLIEGGHIPDDVTIQVLTQAREHIIHRTFESLKGCRRAIVNVYNPISFVQREQVFKKSKEEVKALAVSAIKLCRELADQADGEIILEYTPESFTGSEPEYALEVCNAVIEAWQPTPEEKMIIDLPVTVELSLPHIYASQVEYINENICRRDSVILSVHPHNDRGCGVADTELALLAGAERVEGTLFGNGERTGNVDLVTLALNMMMHGVDPQLDFSDLPSVIEVYERTMRMQIPPRQPYAGSLVFAAFSGSHQDAIAKAMQYREETGSEYWTVPYLPIDPKDIGRTYAKDVIRINSQSGKGGVGYLLEQRYGYNLPAKMREDMSFLAKQLSDQTHMELTPHDVHVLFKDTYVNNRMLLDLTDYNFVRSKNTFKVFLTVTYRGEEYDVTASGNGRLDAVSNAVKKLTDLDYTLSAYQEHALERGSASRACSYVGIEVDGETVWGAGVHEDIITASIIGLISAVNRKLLENE